MEKYATHIKTFEECINDKPLITKDNEIVVTIGYTQYIVKIRDNKCAYYKALQPREI